jgi:16S rRNA A1518/A1519 N6-dimethyltransferase RsmA/KsgA/DIM1 with predicted DNA glycosylase/AP lyase activity
LFCQIVKRAFSQRRKMMFKLLKEDWPREQLSAVFAQAGLPREIRAEAVGLRQFTLLARLLGEGRGKAV